jgi:hypothetical protein
LGYIQLKVLVHQKQKLETTTRGRVYATSASYFVAEEGMAEAAPAVEGGAGSAVVGVEELAQKKPHRPLKER